MKRISVRILGVAIAAAVPIPHSLAKNQMSPALYTTPRGVMGDHMHPKGGIMVSYRYTRMVMEGSRDGGNSLATEDVLSQFPVAPTSMVTEVHLFGVTYAPSNSLTVMAMIPYLKKRMKHISSTAMGGTRFATSSSGIGDVTLLGMIRVIEENGHHVHLGAGVSFPAGSLNKRDDTPSMSNAKLAYPMQIGSGTIDLKPSVTYTLRSGRLTWGSQITGTVRLGDNVNGYSYGDRLDATTWGAVRLRDSVSISTRLRFQAWGDVRGADPELNPAMVQTARPDIQAGQRLDLLFGFNLMARIAGSNGHQFGLEAGFPLAQNLNGPQLGSGWTLFAGWQYMF